jgi:hypothetical protein
MVHAEGAARAHVCMFWRPALTIGPRHGFWRDIDVLCKIFGAYVLKLLHGQGHDCEGRVRMALGVAAAEAGKRTALVRCSRASHTRQEKPGNKQPPARRRVGHRARRGCLSAPCLGWAAAAQPTPGCWAARRVVPGPTPERQPLVCSWRLEGNLAVTHKFSTSTLCTKPRATDGLGVKGIIFAAAPEQTWIPRTKPPPTAR